MSPRSAATRSLLVVLGLLLSLSTAGTAEPDPYAAWAGGHPEDALPALHRVAVASDRWDAWYDLGLCAAAAGDRGRAAAWLIEAHRRAPDRDEPRAALRANGTPLPTTWLDRLGPVGAPGTGIAGLVLAALAGLGLGWAATGTRHRGSATLVGALALAAALPGLVATAVDGRRADAAVVRDTQLLDSTGTPVAPLAAGTVVERRGEPWAGRSVIRLADGRQGLVALSDLDARP